VLRKATFAPDTVRTDAIKHASMGRMPTQPENGAQAADLARVNDYDIIAEAYAAENETSLANAYYDRPAILALAGDVAGRRILDAVAGPAPCQRRCATGAPL
jgi:hypothetical protein